ncbi:MAG: DoxX family protein [Candidatus Limnocylindrales bacterium]
MHRPDRRWAPLGLAALFGASGVLHLLRPDVFLPLIPRGLPAPDVIVAVSGLAELACAAGLATRQPWAGPASAALLVAVFPGNAQFALDQGADPAAGTLAVALAWLRLPLQVPMIWAALQARRRD